ncbi:MAG: hypothetical protein OXG37_06175 [Actinomycetia bacterium]|nr:hypothetical protein [Actinomycetes bacterium]
MSGQLSLIDLESDGSGVSGQAVVGLAGDREGFGRRRGGDGFRRLESEIARLLADGVRRTSGEVAIGVKARKQEVIDT